MNRSAGAVTPSTHLEAFRVETEAISAFYTLLLDERIEEVQRRMDARAEQEAVAGDDEDNPEDDTPYEFDL